VKVVGPDYVGRKPSLSNKRLLFAFETAIADVGEAEQAISVTAFGENLGHGAAHGSETHQGNAARGRAIP
jgi:hypothetical protein